MDRVLFVTSSAFGTESQSRRIAAELVAGIRRWRANVVEGLQINAAQAEQGVAQARHATARLLTGALAAQPVARGGVDA
ncbi:MAG TPA: hypothetical protein VEU53_13175 [Stellaceae bacterium]|nr:hypothetical protein [Stellaceae bacterium]